MADADSDVLVSCVRPLGGAPVDILIQRGRIVSVGAGLSGHVGHREDGGEAILLPGLVEAHTHLDKSFLGFPWQPHSGGQSVPALISNERRLKNELSLNAELQSARHVIQSIAMGSTHIRSHVDVDPQVGVRSIEGVMATRERFASAVTIEIVAFPQWGLLTRPGTPDLMEEAMRMGADVVGGLDPSAIDRDPIGHLDFVFDLAGRFGRPVDIHLHETGALGAFTIQEVCRRARVLGMQGMVTLSHAFSLGDEDEDLVARQVEDLAASGVAIMTTGPAGHVAPPVARLKNAGVVVCAGSDGLRDAWQPYGDGDMLARANAVAQRNGFVCDEELAMALETCTTGGATVMRLNNYGLTAGCQADFVLVEADTVAEAVARPPVRRLSVKGGRVVARRGLASLRGAEFPQEELHQ